MFDQGNLMLAEQLSKALLELDVDAFRRLTTEDCVIWQNHVGDDSMTLTREEAILGVQRMRKLVARYEYRNVRRVLTEEGFFQMADACCRTHAGVDFVVPVCVLAQVRDGRIAGYREFIDRKHLAPIVPASREFRQ